MRPENKKLLKAIFLPSIFFGLSLLFIAIAKFLVPEEAPLYIEYLLTGVWYFMFFAGLILIDIWIIFNKKGDNNV